MIGEGRAGRQLKVTGWDHLGPALLSATWSFPAWGVTSTEEAPNFTSPGYSDRALQDSEPGHEVPQRGLLAAGCLDKDPDSRWRVRGQWKDSGGTAEKRGITCQLGKVNVKNDGCQPVRTRGGGGIIRISTMLSLRLHSRLTDHTQIPPPAQPWIASFSWSC